MSNKETGKIISDFLKETEHKRIITERFGHQGDSDSSFTRKARLLQSIYRVEIGEKEGTGPTKNSHRYYGNMICGGDVSGANFLMPETFEYAKERVNSRPLKMYLFTGIQ